AARRLRARVLPAAALLPRPLRGRARLLPQPPPSRSVLGLTGDSSPKAALRCGFFVVFLARNAGVYSGHSPGLLDQRRFAMAFVEWVMQGTQVSHCNCNIGCPCQFNALPTHGNCRAYMFMQIDKGHYGNVKLDGVRWGGMFMWPGPIHEGNGTAMVVVDQSATPEQKAAIEAVASGQDTDPGSLITQVFSTTLTKVLPTQVKPIELKIDMQKRTARVKVDGLVEGNSESIKNPITGEPHVVSV